MEQQDDFESLLRGAANRFVDNPLSQQSVSQLIDERLANSKKGLMKEFRNEVILIVVGLIGMIYFLYSNIVHKDLHTPAMFDLLNVTFTGGILYMFVCLCLFLGLIRISNKQRGIGVKEYITDVYKKTQQTLRFYLWFSTLIAIVMVVLLLGLTHKFEWYWVAAAAGVAGVLMHYANVCYISKRFGKRVNEIKHLMEEVVSS